MPGTALRFYRPHSPQPEQPLLLYLPGMDGSGHLFYRQSPALRPYFDICCLELPPQGRPSWAELSAQTLAGLREELAASSRDRPVYLCGESFGGCLALQLALDAPETVDCLIAINPASSFRQRPGFTTSAPLLQYLPDWLQRTSCWGLLPFLADLNRLDASDRQALLAAMQALPAAAAGWRLELLSRFALAESALRQLHQPTLLVGGAGDRLLPSVAEVRRLASKLPRARVAILPESGHACLLERDWRLADLLAEQNFLPPEPVAIARANRTSPSRT